MLPLYLLKRLPDSPMNRLTNMQDSRPSCKVDTIIRYQSNFHLPNSTVAVLFGSDIKYAVFKVATIETFSLHSLINPASARKGYTANYTFCHGHLIVLMLALCVYVCVYVCVMGVNVALNNLSAMAYWKGTVEPRYLELAYFELPLISKWKSGPCFNMKLWQQVTK